VATLNAAVGTRLRVLLGIALCWGVCAHAQTVDVPASAPFNATPVDREVRIAEDAFARDPQVPSWVTLVALPDVRPKGPITIALADTQIHVGDPVVTFSRQASRINDQVALSAAGRFSINFIPDYQRVVLHTLRVWRDGVALDRLAGAQIRFLQREGALEQNLYSGVVTASLLIDDVRVGDTLEVAYSLSGINPVFGKTWSGIADWDQRAAIGWRRVTLHTPVDRRIAWKDQGPKTRPIGKPRESVHDGWRTLTFEERDLEPIKPEAQVPNGFILGRWLQFSEFTSWNEVATWGSSLFDGVADSSAAPDPARAALIAQFKALPDDEQRTVAALEFVQSQIRYFSVSIGTSSHRPASPATVLARRYGDCKDKSLLLVTLLADLGIRAEPVLAHANNRVGFDDWLPTPIAFDHVFVVATVGGTRWWLDPTRLGQHGKLARMGQVHDGIEVLVASRDTRGLERIVVPDRQDLADNELVEDLTVDKLDGPGRLVVDRVGNGVIAETVRVLSGAGVGDRLETAMNVEMGKRYPGAKLVEAPKIDDDRVENRVRMHYAFDIPTPLTKTGEGWVARFVPDNVRVFALPADGDASTPRQAPVALVNPVNASYRFELHLPDAVSAMSNDVAGHVSDAYFDVTTERSFRGNHAIATMHVETLQTSIAATDIEKTRDDIAKLDRLQPTNFLLRTADVKEKGFLGIGRQDLATTLKRRQETIVARITATLKSGRLSGNDLARAYCARGAASLSLGEASEGLADADKAVEIDPDAPDMLVCRGEIRVGARQYAGAIDDLSRAVVMGAENGTAYQLRGQAKFFLGRYPDAATDFAKADSVDRDERSTMYHDVWRAMAYRRSNQPLPDDLARRAAAEPRGAWPRPVLALFADRLGPEELGPLAAQGSGDAATMDGTEADFYRGEWYLARGEVAKAREAFTASRARGVINYTEYFASNAELAKLDGAKP
jgi:lipoprotein NlpI